MVYIHGNTALTHSYKWGHMTLFVNKGVVNDVTGDEQHTFITCISLYRILGLQNLGNAQKLSSSIQRIEDGVGFAGCEGGAPRGVFKTHLWLETASSQLAND